MNESKVVISSTLDPRHLVCNFLNLDKMTLVWAVFHIRKMTWSNKPNILQSKISVEKSTIVAIRNMFGGRKNKQQKNRGPLRLFNRVSKSKIFLDFRQVALLLAL